MQKPKITSTVISVSGRRIGVCHVCKITLPEGHNCTLDDIRRILRNRARSRPVYRTPISRCVDEPVSYFFNKKGEMIPIDTLGAYMFGAPHYPARIMILETDDPNAFLVKITKETDVVNKFIKSICMNTTIDMKEVKYVKSFENRPRRK